MSDYYSKNQKHKAQSVIAYFSMEVGIELDKAGNIYASDDAQNVIVKLDRE